MKTVFVVNPAAGQGKDNDLFVKSLNNMIARTDADATVYITKSGTKFHRAGCSSLSKSKIAISYEDAISRGFEPCGRCAP